MNATPRRSPLDVARRALRDVELREIRTDAWVQSLHAKAMTARQHLREGGTEFSRDYLDQIEREIAAAHVERSLQAREHADLRFEVERARMRLYNEPGHAPHRYFGGTLLVSIDVKWPSLCDSRSTGIVEGATRALDRIPAWVPQRICEEEIGDALEQIHRLAREAAPGWEQQVQRKVLSTKFWVLVHALREIVSAAFGRKSA